MERRETDWESEIARVAPSGDPVRMPDDVWERLRCVAALLRDASSSSAPRLLWREAGGVVQEFSLTRACVVGRDPACDVVLGDPRVSRRHFAVAQAGGALVLRELGSTHGTRVNGAPPAATGQVLRDGDVIQVGGGRIVFAAEQ